MIRLAVPGIVRAGGIVSHLQVLDVDFEDLRLEPEGEGKQVRLGPRSARRVAGTARFYGLQLQGNQAGFSLKQGAPIASDFRAGPAPP